MPAESGLHFRFSLARLLLFMVVLSFLLGLNTRNPSEVQPWMAVSAFSFSLLVLIYHPGRYGRLSKTGRIACKYMIVVTCVAYVIGCPFPPSLIFLTLLQPPLASYWTPPVLSVLFVPVEAYCWGRWLSSEESETQGGQEKREHDEEAA